MPKMRKFRVTWLTVEGQRKRLDFYSRQQAIRVLNVLILDHGIAHARMRAVMVEDEHARAFSPEVGE